MSEDSERYHAGVVGGAVPDALRLHRLWYQPSIFRYRLGNVVLDDIHRPSHSHCKYHHLLLRTVDSRLLGRSSTRLQLNWVLLEQKSVLRCTHYVPVLMWVAHFPCECAHCTCEIEWQTITVIFAVKVAATSTQFPFFLRLIQCLLF